MAYADDCFVFLKDSADLDRLMAHLNVYSLASNAKINTHKTHAISLSGHRSHQWQQQLERYGIHSWYDNTSTQALVYLGYPLYSTPAQRDHFFQDIFAKLQSSCQLYSQRSLSIRGRATALNVLILSKLWHVLRVCPVTKALFQKVQSMCHRFLTFKMWPKISYSRLVLSRSAGGLAILHPPAQQLSLQLRWLQPLFDPAHHKQSFIHSWIIHVLHGWSDPADPLLCLLFKNLRPKSYQVPVSFVRLLCHTLDQFTLDLDHATLATDTILRLHILDTIHPPARPMAQSVDKLWSSLASHTILFADLFELDSNQGCLRLKAAQSRHCYPRLIHQLQSLLDHHLLSYQSFACRAYVSTSLLPGPPYPSALEHDIKPVISLLLLEDLPFLQIKRNWFRQILIDQAHHLPDTVQDRSPFPWSRFWNMQLSTISINIWFRALHHKLPCRDLLHRYLPQSFASPLCPICLQDTDTLEHFLFLCTRKFEVWTMVWQDLLLHDCSTTIVSQAIFKLQFPPSPPTISSSVIIAITMEALWKAHWRFIFDQIPFQPQHVLIQVQRGVAQYIDSLRIDQL